MNAKAVADAPPVISSMTPRSQVIRDTGVWFFKVTNTRVIVGSGLTNH